MAKKKPPTNNDQKPQPAPKFDNSKPIITVDYELYAHYLDDADLSEDEKREFLQTLWNIIVEFVSLGFGVHPVQQAQDSCGKHGENPLIPGILAVNPLELMDKNVVEKFDLAAGANGAGTDKESSHDTSQ